MADQTDLSQYLSQLFGQAAQQQNALPTSGVDQTDSQPSQFTPQNTMGLTDDDIDDVIDSHPDAQTLGLDKKASLGDHIKTLVKSGLRGSMQELGQFLMQRSNPDLFAQQQENQRLQAQFAQQNFIRNNPSTYEQAQIQQMHDAAGLNLYKILSDGGQIAQPGQTPDFSYGGKGIVMPKPDKTYNVAANSDLGKRLGLSDDLSGLSQDQYLKNIVPLMEHIHTENNDQAQTKVMNDQIDSLVSAGQDAATKRYAQSADPSAQNNLSLFNQQLQAAATEAKARGTMAPVTALLHGMNEPTQWEKMRDKADEYRQQLKIKAAEAGAKGDPHLMGAINSQSRAIDEIEKPIQKEWEDGENIRGLAAMKNPAADAQLIPAMQPYITGMKRFSDTELKSIRGGATAWTNIQHTLNKYSSDPYHAQIPDDQRAQLIGMITAKQANLKGQIDKINDARDDIAGMTQSADVLKRSAKLHRDLATPSASTPATGLPNVGDTWNGGKVLSIKRIN
jgi:hypothetical protein